MFRVISFFLQGFIVTSPQLGSNTSLIAPLGSQYPPGTKFAIVPGNPDSNIPLRN